MLSSLPSIAFTVIGFGFLILFHEAGHFLFAKRARIRAHHFAIGFGPVLLSYRPGVGWSAGSTAPATLAKLRAAGVEGAAGVEQIPRAVLAKHGIGETQYELRLLPLGGFVGMAGQDDTDPGARSDEEGSFNRAPLSSRIWVISGGVIANLLLGVIFFGIAFWHGVEFESATIGLVAPDSPAGLAGLRAGDTILSIDGEPIETFTDCRVATALSPAGAPLSIVVSRGSADGGRETLTLTATPEDAGGIRQIGIRPSTSLRIDTDRLGAGAREAIASLGIALPASGGVAAITAADGRPVSTWEELSERFAAADGRSVMVTVRPEAGPTNELAIPPVAPLPAVLTPGASTSTPNVDLSIAGLVPLTLIKDVLSDGAAAGVLQPGDIVLQAGGIAGPTMRDFRAAAQAAAGTSLPLTVERGGVVREVSVAMPRSGIAGVYLTLAMDDPRVAQPLPTWMAAPGAAESEVQARDGQPSATPAAEAHVMALSRIVSVDGGPVTSWRDFAALVRSRAEAAPADATSLVLDVGLSLPTAGNPLERAQLALEPWAIAAERDAQWGCPLTPDLFLPNQVVLSAAGHPLQAVGMGFHQTGVILTNVFLTLRALVSGDVGVSQLSGPLGIVHAGTMAAERSSWYLLFFLALISVNLAFLNALPIPIADGGHMVYLLWEAVTGRMPSPRFQNAAAIVGLVFFAGLFLLTFYNDVLRLLS